MDLRQQLIKLSEQHDFSEAFTFEEVTDVRFIRLNTTEGEKISMQFLKAQQEGKVNGMTSKILVQLLCNDKGELVFKPSDFGILEKLPISFFLSSE